MTQEHFEPIVHQGRRQEWDPASFSDSHVGHDGKHGICSLVCRQHHKLCAEYIECRQDSLLAENRNGHLQLSLIAVNPPRRRGVASALIWVGMSDYQQLDGGLTTWVKDSTAAPVLPRLLESLGFDRWTPYTASG
jgi:hypothetical protein